MCNTNVCMCVCMHAHMYACLCVEEWKRRECGLGIQLGGTALLTGQEDLFPLDTHGWPSAFLLETVQVMCVTGEEGGPQPRATLQGPHHACHCQCRCTHSSGLLVASLIGFPG